MPDEPETAANEIVYVPHAIMPLPIPTDTPSGDAPRTMMVALLTYRPRFDVDLESFYVDVEIDPAHAIEPFVRLGLVRYQANAPPTLRVSEPVVEWAQLLPRRSMRVEVSQAEGGFGLRATVDGPARHGRGAADADARLGARMDFSVYRTDAAGRQDRVAQTSSFAEPTEKTWVTAANALVLPEDPRHPVTPGTSYMVVATETNIMRPATYADEPNAGEAADAAGAAGAVSSGPRFAMIVPLSGNIGVPQPSRTSDAVIAIHAK